MARSDSIVALARSAGSFASPWFSSGADVTIDVQAHAYCPFIRLALVRYQPHALPDAKLSAVALADYAQLTPERSAVVTADPYHPRRLRLTVSGPGPTGPAPVITGRPPTTPVYAPTTIVVSVEERDDAIQSDLGWRDAPAAVAAVAPQAVSNPTGLIRWSGSVTFAATPPAGRYRLVIREYEYLSANYTELASAGRPPQREQPKRLVYAEILEIDAALIGGPSAPTGTVIDA